MGISAALFDMLLAYYSCDYIATTRLLSFDEAQACATIYEHVKTEVSRLDSRNPDTRIEAYLSWKQWELDNADLVSAIKDQAIDNIEN